MSAQVPIYRYTVTRTDGTQTAVDAVSYRDQDEWLVFDDVPSTVLTIRRERVDEIARSLEPVGSQHVDELTDPEPEN